MKLNAMVMYIYFCLELSIYTFGMQSKNGDTETGALEDTDRMTKTEKELTSKEPIDDRDTSFMKSYLQYSVTTMSKLNITHEVTKDLNRSFEKTKSRCSKGGLETSTIDGNTRRVSKDTALSLHVDRCVLYGRCDSAYVPNWYCQCDEECERYKDCCQGYNFTENSFDIEYTCVSIFTGTIYIWGVHTISNCPAFYRNKTVIEKCTDGHMKDTGTPAVEASATKRIYRNIYCAICNGMNADPMDIVFISKTQPSSGTVLDLTHMSKKDLLHYLHDNFAYRLIIPEGVNARYCITGLIQNEHSECRRYINPVFNHENKLFRNWSCYKNLTSHQYGEMCLALLMWLHGHTTGLHIKLAKLTILFTFRQEEKESQTTDLQCQEWSQENDQICGHLPVFSLADFDLDFNINLPEKSTEVEVIQTGLLTIWVKNVANFTTLGEVIMKIDNNSMVLKVHSKSTILKKAFSHEVRSIKEFMNNQKISIIETNLNGRKFETNKQYSKISPNVTTLFYTENLVVEGIEYYLSIFNVTIPEEKISEFCEDLAISVSREDNGSLNVTSIDCKPKLLSLKMVSILSVLTYILSSISFLSLIILVAVNRRQNFHVEIPFANLENVAVSMVLANLLFMVGTVTTNAYSDNLYCYGMSIALHYSWLAVFSFTTLAVFQIVRILLKLKARNVGSNLRNTRKRCLLTGLGLTIPLFFVGPAIYIDKKGPKLYSPGYGKSLCFPTQFPGNLIFFTGPVMIAILINSVCLVQIIIRIHMAKMSKGNMRRTTTFSEAKIFLRILVLSGCFWITGILAAYLEFEWLEYVFTILCGSQGLLVAIANLTTSRVQCCRNDDNNVNSSQNYESTIASSNIDSKY